MSKIEIYKEKTAIAKRIKSHYLNAAGLKIVDGKETRDSNNDKHRIMFHFDGLLENWGEIKLRLHLSHGYYGSSSGYSDTCKDTGKYVAIVLNGMGQMILERAVELAKADAEQARLDAEQEARMVLQQTKELAAV